MQRRGLKALVAAAALAAVVAGLASRAAAAPAATYRGFPVARLVVDGLAIENGVPPLRLGGQTFAPLQAIAEAAGVRLEWDPVQARIHVDGQPAATAIPTVTVDGTVLVPVRPVAEAIGGTVRWDPETETAFVYGPGRDPTSAAVVHRGGGVPLALARALAGDLDRMWARVAGELGHSPAGRTPEVWLFEDREEWYRHLVAEGVPEASARRVSEHAEGTASGGDHVHVVVSADEPFEAEVRVALLHELGHVALDRRNLSGRLPQWVHEGLVETVARRLEGHLPTTPQGNRWRGALRKQVLDDWLEGRRAGLITDPDEFFDRFAEFPAHAEAALAVDRLEHDRGAEALTRYVDAVAAGGDPGALFEQIFGISVEAFESEFQSALREEALRRPALRAVFEVPPGTRAYLTAYGPGRSRSDVWVLDTAGQVTVTVGEDGAASVTAPRRRRYYGRLDEPPGGDEAVVFVTWDPPLDLGGRRLKGIGVAFQRAGGEWAWTGTSLYWTDGEPQLWLDPQTPAGLRLVEVSSR